MGETQAGGTGRRAPGRLQTAVVTAAAIAVIIAGVALSGGGSQGAAVSVTAGAPAPVVGGRLPDFSAKTPDGRTVSLSDFAGKPLWLTFGASWCPDCRTEAPDVQAAYAEYQPAGLALVAVFEEGGADISAYAARAGLSFPILSDPDGSLRSALHALGLPTHYFVGADGVIRAIRVGGLAPSDMRDAIGLILPR
jgi:peroxiredoxin